MNEKMLWQFYITFWSTLIVSFFVIYGCDFSLLKSMILSSVSSATLSVINIYFQNRCKTRKNEMQEIKEIKKGLSKILIDYESEEYYKNILNNAIKKLVKIERKLK